MTASRTNHKDTITVPPHSCQPAPHKDSTMRSIIAVAALCLTLLTVTCAVLAQQEEGTTPPVLEGATPCRCGPPASEGGISGLVGIPAKKYNGTFHIDAKNQRSALYQTVAVRPGRVHTIAIIVREKFAYIVIPSQKRCRKVSYPETISTCIGKKAVFVQSFSLGGAGGASIKVNEWMLPQRHERSQHFVRVFLSADKCVRTFAVSGSSRLLTTEAFVNVTSGIKDKSVFTLPAYCKKDTEEEEMVHQLAQEVFEAHQARLQFFE